MRPRVLLVEDDQERGEAMIRSFSERFECRWVATIEAAFEVLPQGGWEAVVANYGLSDGGSGIEVMQAVRETLPRAFRLIYNEIPSESFRRDAERIVHPHFTTEATDPDFVAALQQRLAVLLEPPSLEIPASLPTILTDIWTGHSPVIREYLIALRAAAEQSAPVYVHGEPGTGVTRSGITLRQWRREWRTRGAPGMAVGEPPVCILRVPSLRERLQDLPVLAARCLLENARQTGEPLRRLSPLATEELLSRDWYGNVVELGATLARALQRVGARLVIEAEDLPRDVQAPWRPSQYAKDEGQRDCVLRQLRSARNVSAASRLEGCSRANYIRLMRRLGIIRADIAAGPSLDGLAGPGPG